jgi:phosphoglucomutase
MGLLAAEMTARTGIDPERRYVSVTQDLGKSFYERIDAPATREQRALLADLDPARVDAKELAGEPIHAKVSRAPGNNAAIGGSRWLSKAVGSPPGRQARRPSTRFAPRISAARNTSGKSSMMRRRSSRARSPRRNLK